MPVPILEQDRILVVPTPRVLTDSEWRWLTEELLEAIPRTRPEAVIVDVSRVPEMDSFAGRTLVALARTLQLRGVKTVVVGIQPDVAYAMVQLGLTLSGIRTALDLRDGLALLARERRRSDR